MPSHHGRALQVRRADLDEVVALLRGEETVVEERLGLVRQLLHVRIADADVIGVQRTGVVSHPALVRRHDLRRAVARVRSARVWPRHLPEPADEALLLGADDLGADATRESRETVSASRRIHAHRTFIAGTHPTAPALSKAPGLDAETKQLFNTLDRSKGHVKNI